MDYKKLLTGLLSGPYKLDEGRISEILDEKSDESVVLAEILSEDKTRIQKLKPSGEDGKTKFQEGYAKAKKEERQAFEKELKEEYGIDSDLQGKELIEHIVTTKTTEATKGKKPIGELTEDEVKALPLYRKMENQFKKQIADKETEWTGKLEEEKNNFSKKELFGSFKQEALNVLDTLKPILGSNATVARSRRELFAKSLEDEGLEIKREGNDFFLLKDGKRLEDGHGNAIDYKDFIKSRAADHFEFEANNGGSNSGNSNQQKQGDAGNNGGAGKKYPDGIKKPTNLQEYGIIINDKSIPYADRQAVMEAYNAENARTE